jgi:hypothetical protein
MPSSHPQSIQVSHEHYSSHHPLSFASPGPFPLKSSSPVDVFPVPSDSVFEPSSDENEDDSDEYAMYPMHEDVPVDYLSDVYDDDESQSIFVNSPDEVESSIRESPFEDDDSSSEVSIHDDNNLIDDVIPLVQPLPTSSSGTLEPLNLAFATWSWTHGISYDGFHNLQQLLHSGMIDQALPLLCSLKGVREQVMKFLRLCPLQSIRIKLKVSKLSTHTRNSTRVNKTSTALISTNAWSTHFYHQIRDLLYRVLSNPQLKSRIYNEQFSTIH